MANRVTKKRIYARTDVNVDERTANFRGSANRVDARGDLGGQMIGRDYSNLGEISAWSQLSDTFGMALSVHLRNKEKTDARAEEERRRNQAFMDQRMTLAGDRIGIEESNKAREMWESGALRNFDEVQDYIQNQITGLDPSMDHPAFIAMSRRMSQTLDEANNFFTQRFKDERSSDAKIESGRLIGTMFDDLKENNDPAEWNRFYSDAAYVAKEQGNMTDAEFNGYAFTTGLSKMRSFYANGDTEKAMLARDRLLEWAGTFPDVDAQGRTREEQVWDDWQTEADRQKARDHQEEIYAEQALTKQRTVEYNTFLGSIGGAEKAEDIDAIIAPLSNMSDLEVYEKYGVNRLSVVNGAEQQKEFLLTGKRPQGNLQAMEEIENLVRYGDSRILYDDEFLETMYGDRLLPSQKAAFREQIDKKRAQKQPDIDQIALRALAQLEGDITTAKTAYTNTSRLFDDGENLESPVPNRMGHRVLLQIRQHVEQSVNPADYQNDPVGLNDARNRAADEIIAKLSNGNIEGFELHKQADEVNRIGMIQKDYPFVRWDEAQNDPQLYEGLKNTIIPNGKITAASLPMARRIQDVKLQQAMVTEVNNLSVQKLAVEMARRMQSDEWIRTGGYMGSIPDPALFEPEVPQETPLTDEEISLELSSAEEALADNEAEFSRRWQNPERLDPVARNRMLVEQEDLEYQRRRIAELQKEIENRKQ